MSMADNNAIYFQDLRELAYKLDLYVGIERRKEILDGHEKLMWSTDATAWGSWLTAVRQRLDALTDLDFRSGLRIQPDFLFKLFGPLLDFWQRSDGFRSKS